MPPGTRTERPFNALAIAAIASILLCWPAGIVLAIIALQQINRTGERGRGLAITALALGAAIIPALCLLTAYAHPTP
jgi:hypothetical protein